MLLVAGIGVAGCSGSRHHFFPRYSSSTGVDSATSASSTNSGGFAAELNAICKQFTAQPVSSNAEYGEKIAKYLPKIDALTPPAAKKAAYEQFISISEQQVVAAKKNDAAALKSLAAKNSVTGEKLGAPECAK
jgi:hypothetical protein